MSTLKEVIKIAVNSLEAGVDNKEDVESRIYEFVKENYLDKKLIETLPVNLVQIANTMGMKVEVSNGRVSDIDIDAGSGCIWE